MKPVLLLTGLPGVGKSTLIKRVIDAHPGCFGGFYTREMRVDGERTGFELVTLEGGKTTLAAKGKVWFPHQARLGSYVVDVDALDRAGVPALLDAAGQDLVVVIDEIGPMELFSPLFRSTVLDLLNDPQVAVLGTVVYRPHPLADGFKRHPRVHLVQVDRGNRDSLVDEVGRALGLE